MLLLTAMRWGALQWPLTVPFPTVTASCPAEAAACLISDSQPKNLGRVRDGPQWDGTATIIKYVDGDLCPDKIRKRSTTIRFICSDGPVVSA